MADVQPLRALHYDQAAAGPLQQLVAPPYDVIDPAQREELAGRSPHNVVQVDLPAGDDPYATAAELMARWQDEGAIVRDATPALWALTQDYTGPDERALQRALGSLATDAERHRGRLGQAVADRRADLRGDAAAAAGGGEAVARQAEAAQGGRQHVGPAATAPATGGVGGLVLAVDQHARAAPAAVRQSVPGPGGSQAR